MKKFFSGHPILGFLVKYLLFMSAALVLLGWEPITRLVDLNGLYTRGVASTSAVLIRPFGILRGVEGSILHLRGISLNLLFGCNGLEAFLIYSVAVLAYPQVPWKKKGWGVVFGFVLLQVANVLRILGLALCAVFLESYFDLVHTYLTQGVMIAMAFLVFLGWLRYAETA